MCILFHLFPLFRFFDVQIFLFFFSHERIGVLSSIQITFFFLPGLIKAGSIRLFVLALGSIK
jgi:hypothetical protein